MRRRVVITGFGCITPLGTQVEQVWHHLAEGHSGIGPISLFDARDFPVRIAAEVSDWDISEHCPDPGSWQQLARQTQFAVAAGWKAVQHSGLSDTPLDPLKTGVFLGCGEIFPDFDHFCSVTTACYAEGQFQPEHHVRQACRAADRDAELNHEAGSAVSFVSSILNAQGPHANFTSACVSSSKAVGESLETIRRGDADVILSGGSHSMIHPFGLTGFHRLSTLSTRNEDPPAAPRPFDRDRDGFVIGEGAVILVLEELQHARQRGADIWAELTGYASTHDAFRITDPHPSGDAAARSMRLSLHDAQLDPEDIVYINAHGSGTIVNDKVETLAIKKAFGHHAYRTPVSSTKSMTGHLTTACGAIELFAVAMSIRHGVLPPTINYATPDPDCDLDYVPNTSRELSCPHILKHNSGFGGQNVSLVVSRYDG